MSVQVVATRRGFHGQLREADEVFLVDDEKQIGSWMERAGDPAKPAKDKQPDPAKPAK